jgi:hypothetical protein
MQRRRADWLLTHPECHDCFEQKGLEVPAIDVLTLGAATLSLCPACMRRRIYGI